MPKEPPRDPSEAETLLRKTLGTASESTAPFVLTVLEGPETGQRFVIDGSGASPVLVGQSPACDFRLSDRHVSRRHVSIEPTPQGLRVTDLESTNGTFVNGLTVFDARLSGGETIRIGETVLFVEPAAQTVAAPAPAPTAMRFGRLVGASPQMRRLYPLCERLAASEVPVVIEGETGTGKELLAESIHEEGPRANGPFVVFDCTTVPPNLLESALFGHERGAFTGAVTQRRGVFEVAHGGTLLIDEIGELDVALQSKLLRAIERGEVQRVGGSGFMKVDVRLLAATRRDLDREVQAGRFRDDLFYRLAVARLELPALRRRTGDVAVLTRWFWQQLGGSADVPPDVLLRFEEYTWPGNVRELHNAVARRVALGELASGEPLGAGLAPRDGAAPAGHDTIGDVVAMDLPLVTARQRVVDEFERRYIERVLSRHGGNVVRAAAASGIARRYFYVLKAKQSQNR
jgi:two-component system response regulator HydG